MSDCPLNRAAEVSKWDKYFDDLAFAPEDECTALFNRELVDAMASLLPQGGRTLEAGCGAGWHSLALARNGFQTSLLDFSEKALDYARRVFDGASTVADFIQEDLLSVSTPGFDMVFNAGVLEHYSFEDQVRLVRSMASHSRRYVLVLVPNRRCSWYWTWRRLRCAEDAWLCGKGTPVDSLARVFEEAGLHMVGERYFGTGWTESFVRDLIGDNSPALEHFLDVHRSPVVAESERAYLVGALGTIVPGHDVPPGWSAAPGRRVLRDPDLRALVDAVQPEAAPRGPGKKALITVDALSEQIADLQAENRELVERVRDLEQSRELQYPSHPQRPRSDRESESARRHRDKEVEWLRAELKALQAQVEAERHNFIAGLAKFDSAVDDSLATLRSQRAWQVMLIIRKAYSQWTREGLRGKLEALAVPFRGLLAPDRSLQLHDIHLPCVWDFVPDITVLGNGPAAAGSAGARARYDVIVLPVFDFEFRFQRPQQIAAQFARSGHRVFWVSPSRCSSESEAECSPELVRLRENLFEVRLPGPLKNIYTDNLSPADADRFAEAIEWLCRNQNVAEAVTVVQFPFWAQVALNLRRQLDIPLIYDCMDDWTNWTAEPRISTFALTEQNRLAIEADVVTATSTELQQRLQSRTSREVIRVRNGTDFPFFRNGSPCGLLADVAHPIVGYYGAIADWVDVNLMVKLARSRPHYSFVIIGEVHGVDTTVLRNLSNVHMLGEKPYRLLPAYLAEFDVCILPFKLNELTRAVDPVKVYEYLSQGKPVVATPLPEVFSHREFIYLAPPEDFAAALDRALQEDTPELQSARRSHAEKNGWADRAGLLDSAIVAKFPLVSILIVAYKSREFLELVLDSIHEKTAYPNYEIIVVDNCSGDGSAEFLEEQSERFPQFRAFVLDENKGFAGGNNFAAQQARGEYLVLLNADTMVTWGWLERLMRPLRRDPSTGVTAPVTNFSGNETRIATDYGNIDEMHRFAGSLADLKCGEVLELKMVPLLCVMVRHDLWRKAGGLDEQFGLGMFEDDDFAIRVRRLGYKIVTVEDCFIHHFGNGSFAKLDPKQSQALFDRNKAYFEAKWGRRWRPHSTREGVNPPTEADRVSPARFRWRESATRWRSNLRLIRLHPISVGRGGTANLQPDGASVIVAVCEGASPGTVIKFGEHLLPTAYGSGNRVSATLPLDFSRVRSSVPVSLVNDFESSNTVLFRVE